MYSLHHRKVVITLLVTSSPNEEIKSGLFDVRIGLAKNLFDVGRDA